MIRVSEVKTKVPSEFKTELEKAVFDVLVQNNIEFFRVENDDAITMADCEEISKRLNCNIVKTLFLCNRQKTNFYLYVVDGNKPFVTKDFGKALNISRVSFADETLLLSLAKTTVGATTFFSAILDTENKIQVVMDKDITLREWYGCTDGTTTGYMKLKTQDVLKILNLFNHKPIIIE